MDDYCPLSIPKPDPALRSHKGRPKNRHDGWTVARQAHFLHILAVTRSVTSAARSVGMSRESAHRLRARDPSGLFAAMWARCFAPTSTPRSAAEVDESHRRVIAIACGALGPPRVPIRETWSTS